MPQCNTHKTFKELFSESGEKKKLAGTKFLKPWENKNQRTVRGGEHRMVFYFFHNYSFSFLARMGRKLREQASPIGPTQKQ